MNNLESLKSELLYEYSEEEFNLWRSQNFYQHHNLPSRTYVKTSQGANNVRKTMIQISTKKKQNKPSELMTKTIGRNLFSSLQKLDVPGPGAYESPLKRHSSHCYIKKEQEFVEGKIAKRLRKRKLINQCRGPGIYNPETAFNLTSKSKAASQGTFSRTPIHRLIMPRDKIENLYLTSSNSQQYLRGSSQPDPFKYGRTKNFSSNSKFPRPIGFTMSTTQRSNLINNNGLPGPGFYNWSKLYQRKTKAESKQKGKIEYKFVYGHPS